MPPIIASVICYTGIVGLFWLDRNGRSRTSPALWIAQIWFFLACSRTFSRWLEIRSGGGGSITDQLSEGSPADQVLLSTLIIVALIVLFNRRQQIATGLRDCWPIVLFFFYCLVSVLWSDFPLVAFKRWDRAIGDWIMVFLVWSEPDPRAALKSLLSKLSFTLIPISVLFNKYYPDLGRVYANHTGDIMYTGVSMDKNGLGAICFIFGLGAAWRILELLSEQIPPRKRRRLLVPQFVILAMVIWMFSYVNSQTALSCFLLACCVLCAVRTRAFRKSRGLVHCLVVVLIAVPLSIALLGMSPGALQAIGRNSTLTDRTRIWHEIVKLVPNSWVGAGYGSFWLGPRLDIMIRDVTHWWVPNQAHNGYLEIWANLGWVGVALLAIVILWGYRKVILTWRRDLPGSSLMLAYFIGGIIYNITEAALFRNQYSVWMFILLAMSIPVAARVRLVASNPVLEGEAVPSAMVVEA